MTLNKPQKLIIWIIIVFGVIILRIKYGLQSTSSYMLYGMLIMFGAIIILPADENQPGKKRTNLLILLVAVAFMQIMAIATDFVPRAGNGYESAGLIGLLLTAVYILSQYDPDKNKRKRLVGTTLAVGLIVFLGVFILVTVNLVS